MIRRYLFWGLTLALAAVLVSLVLRGRRQEQLQSRVLPSEIVRTSPPTATRVLAPSDLEIVDVSGRAAPRIRNLGRQSYKNIVLRVAYLSRSGRVLAAREDLVPATIPPGQTVPLEGVDPPGAPSGWSRRTIRVLYAELAK